MIIHALLEDEKSKGVSSHIVDNSKHHPRTRGIPEESGIIRGHRLQISSFSSGENNRPQSTPQSVSHTQYSIRDTRRGRN